MKKLLLLPVMVFITISSFSQLLVTNPQFPTESVSPLTITMDGDYGNRAFYNFTTTVYVHIGVITNLSTSNGDWKYVRPGDFNQPVPALQANMTGSIPFEKYNFTINGGIRNFFGVPPGETILKIAILFRNADGTRVQRNADGSDMFINVNNGSVETKFTTPFFQPTFNPIPEPAVYTVGGSIALTAISSQSANLRLLFDGAPIQTATNSSTISFTQTALTAGSHTITAEATAGTVATRSFNIFVPAANVVQALPSNVRNGINYETDQTAATLVIYAPGKNRVTLIGDLPGSNWQEQTGYQMKRTPDGNYFWLRITGLTPGTEYSYQYLIDGNLRIGDAYAEKILDPWNDQYISSTTYPALKPYPNGLTSGIVSILQTAPAAYTWTTTGYSRPDKRNLMVYELLLRDFIAAHDWNTLSDTLNYLKKLGINTIELMPVNEFEGNNSWGYNPDYYFAPDKYYGPKNDLKRFIDMAHGRGMAVVIDIALNHSFGLSPMVQLYWDAANNRPAANNPWYNPVAKHAFNVGYDFNHSTAPTKYFFSRVTEHWLTEYKIDGFRFDLSKGFTQTQTCDASGNNCDVNAWSNYDTSRVQLWKDYYDSLQLKSAGSFAILEHFAANNEEQELSNYGLMFWGNIHYNFSEAAMGWLSNSNFDGALHVSRGWSNPFLISYMESHDEERITYQVLNHANQGNAGYNIRSLPIATARNAMSAAFLLTMPGPKMIWQFGEQGYDFPINYCEDGSVNPNCRVDPKPIRWDYLQNADRKKLHSVYSGLLQLRNTPSFFDAFTTGFISRDFGNANGFKWMTLNSASGKVVVVGNFNITAQTGSVTFPAAGTWYNYLAPVIGGAPTFNATGGSQSFTLQPGEYYVFINSNVVLPVTLINFSGRVNGNVNHLSWIAENEINMNGYELQRSENGRDFTTIATLSANGSRNYSYADADINRAIVYYYRLKSVNNDATYSYSTIVRLSGAVKQLAVMATPNPFTTELRLTVSSVKTEMATLILTDMKGKVLLQQRINVQEGVNSLKVNNLPQLSAGAYILTTITATDKVSTRLVKAVE